MSVSSFATTMSAIDPNTGQLVELPLDQSGTYVMQDGSTVLTTAQLPPGIQAGKSLLKPELAQHLNQHGYKPTVGRGGFTLGSSDARWGNVTSSRANRSITRKPLGTSAGQMQPASVGLPQNAALASAGSGLLSLGSRYTPSSASIFGASAPVAGGGLVASSGATSGLVPATVTNLSVDRDPNYRIAAAIAGTGGRGRPRGRRPLRGQFPVVPIDMVRQLGIEQQVILQPAAPVAMRNKAVLCRPLSMCRKTQASVVQYEGSSQENGLPTATEEVDDLSFRRPLRKRDIKSQRPDDLFQSDAAVNTSECDEKLSVKRSTMDVETSTDLLPIFVDSHSQTETEQTSDLKGHHPQFIPVPIPIPIFVPAPVYLYARPIPCLLPFPLPCPFPFPVASRNLASVSSAVDDVTAEPPCCFDASVSSSSDDHTDDQPDPLRHSTEEEDQLIIASEPTLLTSAEQIAVTERERGIKRPASPSFSQSDADVIQNDSSTRPHLQTTGNQSHVEAPVVTAVTQCVSTHGVHFLPQVSEPPIKKPRHTIVVSDSNYHLKFSYGINAWRHWVQQKLSGLGGVTSTTVQHEYPHLRTELLSMSETDLNIALSQFVREVRKPNNECYVADSIFYLCLGIQEYLNENGCRTNLFGGPIFSDFTKALDDILANFQPRINVEGLLVCRIEEEHLWEAQQLGDQSPEVLLFTVLYFNTKHMGLRLGTAHRQLAFSQFQFCPNDADDPATETALVCHLPSILFGGVVEEPSISVHLDTNEDNIDRCPVRLFKMYFSRCPPAVRSSDEMFYMCPVYPPDECDYWYSTCALSAAELQVILNRIKMVKEIQEAFMNGQPDCGF